MLYSFLSCFANVKNTPLSTKWKMLTTWRPWTPGLLELKDWWCSFLWYHLLPPISQSEDCAQTDHTPWDPLPHLLLKMLCKILQGALGFLGHELQVCLPSPAVNPSLFCTAMSQFAWLHYVSGTRTCTNRTSWVRGCLHHVVILWPLAGYSPFLGFGLLLWKM